MRLTLRTVLAYLDDILEPAQTKEIGAKITETPVATSLVSRIREVLRRRRLGAPEVEDPHGIDANVVAEYLDNTLPPADVADVERICLESDVHLAEVAASHQVLTLVLGEPVEILPDSRERMYALTAKAASAKPVDGEQAKAGKPAETAYARAEKVGAPIPVTAKAIPSAKQPADLPERRVPSYLNTSPLWKRALPYVLGTVAVGVFLAAVLMDNWSTFNGSGSGSGKKADQNAGDVVVAQNDAQQQGGAQRNDNADKPTDAADPTASATTPSAAATNTGTSTADSKTTDATASTDVPDPTSDSNTPGTGSDVATTGNTTGDAQSAPVATPTSPPDTTTDPPADPVLAAPPDSTAGTATVDSPAPPAAAPPGETPAAPPAQPVVPPPAAPTILYNSQSGVLLRDNAPPKMLDWRVVPHRAVIHAGEHIASVDPFGAVLEIGNDLCQLRLREGTSVTIVPPSENWLFGLDVRQGRLILKALPGSGIEGQPTKAPFIGLKVDNDLWRIQMATPDTVCGIQVERRQPDQFEKLPEPKPYTLALFVTRGSVAVDDGKGLATQVANGNAVLLSPLADRADDAAPSWTVEPLAAVPDWLSEEGPKQLVSAQRTARQFEQEFPLDQPLRNYIPNVVISPNARISALAVKTLAVTESADLLIEALAQKDHEEARLAAIDGMRTWLTLSPDNGKRLPELLKKSFYENEVPIVARLLWGYNSDDVQNVTTANQLVDLLDNENVAIRELAFHNILRLTGLRLNYRANLRSDLREVAVNRWRRHVKEQNGLIRK